MSAPENTQPGTEVATNGDNNAPQQRPQLVHVPLGQPLEDMDQAWRLARAFAQADIVPKALRNNAPNTFLVMLYGRNLGLPPEIAINTIHVVEGRPALSGQLLLAKIREAGHKARKEAGPGWCTWTITRGDDGSDYAETFTVGDAVTAGLCKVDEHGKTRARSTSGKPLPWEMYPARMVQWRALSACADVACPEVKMGFTVEGDIAEQHVERPTFTLAQVAAQRHEQHVAATRQHAAQSSADSPPCTDDTGVVDGEVTNDPDINDDDDVDAARRADLLDIEREHAAPERDQPYGLFAGEEDNQ